MTEDKNIFPNTEPEVEVIDEAEEEKTPLEQTFDVEDMRLDDARRVKSLSPGMLVFKRFIRNKLAVVGLVILIFMFSFAFLGPLFSPYDQAQVFIGLDSMMKNYASANYNTDLLYSIAEGQSFGNVERSQFLLAISQSQDVFTVEQDTYIYRELGEDTYSILKLETVGQANARFGDVEPLSGVTLPVGIEEAYLSAKDTGATSFELAGETYAIRQLDKIRDLISLEKPIAIGTTKVYDAYEAKDAAFVNSYDFKVAAEHAIAETAEEFSVQDEEFSIEYNENQILISDVNGNPFAEISEIIVKSIDDTVSLSIDFKSAMREAIRNNQTSVEYTHEDGETIEYGISSSFLNYFIKRETETTLIRQYEPPSKEHLLGLDGNGMDNLTRLMYGGRISLMVGFVVVILEMFIGVIIGGVSGYFGGGVDTALMRFVDLFNSIPFYPVVIIFGSVMDTLKVDAIVRIFLLMAILGILGWTSIARVVRGQILSLREQDFMIAAEATGIKTSRRIFRHLVPNVMPLLIVSATGSLGGIIITEATLGFLGLGVRYPLASWGSIINAASDPYIMTNFWYLWIPTGLLILLTVLGFNFVGDGLRDAFDPKMKR